MITTANTRRARNGKAMVETWLARQSNPDTCKDANTKDALSDLLHAVADRGIDPRDAVRIALDHFAAERPDLIQRFDERACGEMALDAFAVRNGYVFWLPGGAGGVEAYPGLALDAHGCAARGFYFYHGKAVFGPFPNKPHAETVKRETRRMHPLD